MVTEAVTKAITAEITAAVTAAGGRGADVFQVAFGVGDAPLQLRRVGAAAVLRRPRLLQLPRELAQLALQLLPLKELDLLGGEPGASARV